MFKNLKKKIESTVVSDIYPALRSGPSSIASVTSSIFGEPSNHHESNNIVHRGGEDDLLSFDNDQGATVDEQQKIATTIGKKQTNDRKCQTGSSLVLDQKQRESELALLRKEYEAAIVSMSQQNERIANLLIDIDRLNAKVAGFENESRLHQTKTVTDHEPIIDIDQLRKEHAKAIDNLNERIAALLIDVDRLNADLNDQHDKMDQQEIVHRNQIEQNSSENERQLKTIDQLNERIADLVSFNDRLNVQLNTNQASSTVTNDELMKIQSEHEQLLVTVDKLNDRIADLVVENVRLADEVVHEQRTKVDELHKLQSSHKEEIMKLKVQLEQANTRVDTVGVEAEQRLTLLTNQVDELSRTLEEHNRERIVSNRQLVEKDKERENDLQKIQLLEANVELQQQTIESLRQEIEHERSTLNDTTTDREELLAIRSEHEQLLVTVDKLNDRIAELAVENVRLADEVVHEQRARADELHQLQEEKEKLKMQLDQTSIRVDNDNVEERFTSLSNQVDELSRIIDERNRDLNTSNRQLVEKDQERENDLRTIESLEKIVELQQQTIESLRQEIEHERSTLKDMTTDREELMKIRSEHEQLLVTVDKLNDRIAELAVENVRLADEVVHEQRARVEELQQIEILRCEENDKLKMQLEQAIRRVDTVAIEAEQRIASLSDQVTELGQTLDERSQQLNESNKRLSEKDEEREANLRTIKSLEANAERQQQAIESLRQEMDKERRMVKDLTKERDDLMKIRSEHEQLLVTVDKLNDRIADLVVENVRLADEVVHEQRTKVDELHQLQSSHQEEIMKLKVQLEQANTRVDTVGVEAEQRLTLLTNQVDELSRTLEEHNREQIVSNRQLVEKDKERENDLQKIQLLEANVELQQQTIESLRQELEHDRTSLRDTTNDRDQLMMRNASLSHQVEIVKSESQLEIERITLELDTVGRELNVQKQLLNGESLTDMVENCERKVTEMAEVIKERDTTIRAQQQRMNDLKRTLQKELRSAQPTTTNLAESSSVDSLASGASQQQQPSMSTSTNDYDSANFAYMKHVLLRYLTGTDYQCLQLVRAVVAVLRLNEDEEAAIWDNLNYKLSWLPSAKPPKRLP